MPELCPRAKLRLHFHFLLLASFALSSSSLLLHLLSPLFSSGWREVEELRSCSRSLALARLLNEADLHSPSQSLRGGRYRRLGVEAEEGRRREGREEEEEERKRATSLLVAILFFSKSISEQTTAIPVSRALAGGQREESKPVSRHTTLRGSDAAMLSPTWRRVAAVLAVCAALILSACAVAAATPTTKNVSYFRCSPSRRSSRLA
jgi:hypothetical protein